MKLARLPKANKDGKISLAWLEDYIDARYSVYDDNFGAGAKQFFEDLLELNLVKVDRIEWDSEGQENGQS